MFTLLAEPEEGERHVGGVDGVPHRLRHPGQDVGHSQEVDQRGVLHVGQVVGCLVPKYRGGHQHINLQGQS
jgi:hypothetical protein